MVPDARTNGTCKFDLSKSSPAPSEAAPTAHETQPSQLVRWPHRTSRTVAREACVAPPSAGGKATTAPMVMGLGNPHDGQAPPERRAGHLPQIGVRRRRAPTAARRCSRAVSTRSPRSRYQVIPVTPQVGRSMPKSMCHGRGPVGSIASYCSGRDQRGWQPVAGGLATKDVGRDRALQPRPESRRTATEQAVRGCNDDGIDRWSHRRRAANFPKIHNMRLGTRS